MIHVNDIIGFRGGRRDDTNVNLVDNVFLEFTDVIALPFQQASFVQTVLQEQVGDYGQVTLKVGVNAICAEGFNGSDCSTFCRNMNGVLICEQGIIYRKLSRE